MGHTSAKEGILMSNFLRDVLIAIMASYIAAQVDHIMFNL